MITCSGFLIAYLFFGFDTTKTCIKIKNNLEMKIKTFTFVPDV